MILKMFMEKGGLNGIKLVSEFIDCWDGALAATAENIAGKNTSLDFRGRMYTLSEKPVFIEKPELKINYPLCSKAKRGLGFHILSDGKPVASTYDDAMTCRKTWIFKRNVGFSVFVTETGAFALYRVGFANEPWHYYCLLDAEGKTVGVIKRMYEAEDYRRATLYVEEEIYLLPLLLACLDTIVDVNLVGDLEDYYDKSAGNYISIMQEEKDIFDPAFIARVRAMDGVSD